eukprot:TRINITY_DN22137_c0_g1_i1.p1 TRINITY_DN22137_c0_g1~~TRINITY_DN22137_c0_g1_i1.p1  ORF type:complete len:472 (-),score=58.49 TRINITY_DN22137_c0_g1_i1:149-1495(-)
MAVPAPTVEVLPSHANEEASKESAARPPAVDLKDATTADHAMEEALPPTRLVLVVMIAVIQGYTLIGPLQHDFKTQMKIGDSGAGASAAFTQAAALVQWGKFAMTLGQNFLFYHLDPVKRVYVATAGMLVGTLLPPLIVFTFGNRWLGWVFLSFGCIGLSLGTFEATFLAAITPLGPLTKSWAIMGFPGAFAIVNVFGGLLLYAGLPVVVLFWYIVFGLPVGIFVFARFIVPKLKALSSDTAKCNVLSSNKQASILHSLRHAASWMPMLIPFMAANIVGHFVMEGALPANFNAFNDHQVPLLGRRENDHLLDKRLFFVVFFVFVGLGDMASRRFAYCLVLDTHLKNFIALSIGIACSVLGMYLTVLGVGLVSWASVFLTFWGQGFNYAVSSKFIDRFIPREHNCAAYSFWMFAGSAGAIAGATMVDLIRGWICHGDVYLHECISHHHR